MAASGVLRCALFALVFTSALSAPLSFDDEDIFGNQLGGARIVGNQLGGARIVGVTQVDPLGGGESFHNIIERFLKRPSTLSDVFRPPVVTSHSMTDSSNFGETVVSQLGQHGGGEVSAILSDMFNPADSRGLTDGKITIKVHSSPIVQDTSAIKYSSISTEPQQEAKSLEDESELSTEQDSNVSPEAEVSALTQKRDEPQVDESEEGSTEQGESEEDPTDQGSVSAKAQRNKIKALEQERDALKVTELQMEITKLKLHIDKMKAKGDVVTAAKEGDVVTAAKESDAVTAAKEINF